MIVVPDAIPPVTDLRLSLGKERKGPVFRTAVLYWREHYVGDQ